MNPIGLLFAFVACFCNGTFGVLSKIDYVKNNDVHPFIFNFWAGIGTAISCFFVAIFVGTEFYWQGLISGLFFCIAAALAFNAVVTIGITVASGLWMCIAVLVSYIFGVAVVGDHIASPVISAFGIVVMLIGIVGIVLTNHYAGSEQEASSKEEKAAIINTNGHVKDEYAKIEEQDQYEGESKGNIGLYIVGVVSSVFAGVFGGLIPAPMSFLPEQDQGLPYVPSMGIGVLISAPVVASTACLVLRKRLPMKWKYAIWPGLLSGAIWNVGNVTSLVAILYVGISLAYPIMQAGLFVGGIWGIFLFGELKGKYQVFYWISGLVLVGGIALLTISKGL